ncbi:hypothetical protein INN71_09460 [Nocardioides sp. ChNu-153]|uniref:hypothetical protein n=1 Tax=unclassified Nocardioides TaxID=2615069 RepID=UPI0024060F9C|nr:MULTISPECIES: hypothetical protein [unclassified Nocardioides]MDF9717977.1 hypothetical protein [Nocardioides sp. ChNu-99]MDN7121616.1 hypothetical protein [Nocardioides sp. ChNu-153]
MILDYSAPTVLGLLLLIGLVAFATSLQRSSAPRRTPPGGRPRTQHRRRPNDGSGAGGGDDTGSCGSSCGSSCGGGGGE